MGDRCNAQAHAPGSMITLPDDASGFPRPFRKTRNSGNAAFWLLYNAYNIKNGDTAAIGKPREAIGPHGHTYEMFDP